MRQATSGGEDLGLVGFILDTIDTLGELGVGLLVLLESVIPPIPSEVVLPAAGALIELGRLNGALTWVCALLGSVLGALVLYGAGRAFGEERTRGSCSRCRSSRSMMSTVRMPGSPGAASSLCSSAG